MSDVRTHLLRAKEEVRLGLIGALDGQQETELISELVSIYTSLTEKLKVVKVEFGGNDDVVHLMIGKSVHLLCMAWNTDEGEKTTHNGRNPELQKFSEWMS